MDNQSKHIKLHIGSMITLRALRNYLDSEKIPNLIKDFSESQRLGGFGGSNSVNELYVYEEDKNRANKVLKLFLSE